MESAFSDLSAVLRSIMPGWKIYQNFVAPILDCASKELDDVAYINLLKWRTKKSSGLMGLYKSSWNHHTCEQVGLLAPRSVVAIGSDAGRAYRRYHSGDIYFDAIPRVVGNNRGKASYEAIARICHSGKL